MMKTLFALLAVLTISTAAQAYEGAWYVGGGLSLLDTGSETSRSSEPACRKWYDCQETRLVVTRQEWDNALGLSAHFGYQFKSGVMVLGTVTRYEGDSTGYRKFNTADRESVRRGASWAVGFSVLGRID